MRNLAIRPARRTTRRRQGGSLIFGALVIPGVLVLIGFLLDLILALAFAVSLEATADRAGSLARMGLEADRVVEEATEISWVPVEDGSHEWHEPGPGSSWPYLDFDGIKGGDPVRVQDPLCYTDLDAFDSGISVPCADPSAQLAFYRVSGTYNSFGPLRILAMLGNMEFHAWSLAPVR